jgi:hypothetical protein
MIQDYLTGSPAAVSSPEIRPESPPALTEISLQILQRQLRGVFSFSKTESSSSGSAGFEEIPPHYNENGSPGPVSESAEDASSWPYPISVDEQAPDTHPVGVAASEPFAETSGMFLQPEVPKTTEEELHNDARELYIEVEMAEKKCIEVISFLDKYPHQFSVNQWEASIGLPASFLNTCVDLFLVANHPAASDELKKSAISSMPKRVWDGIYGFLDLMEKRLPASRDYMLALISIAYSTLAVLLEIVPQVEETWMEHMGDLARFGIAAVDGEERGIYINIAQDWYTKAANLNPDSTSLTLKSIQMSHHL